ncbi:DUF4384 domain-containing protein [Aliiruegeria lutimaris]|uniref:DUF4384 domain-containing protein n=1 Tax=Aliiruegeria lutimaris TaxID=571298 RepID=A0A1G8RLM5_9RHOB|nr:DUF4384 domain-containing protein [Aliiruegeria lutimaris]SDJ17898.1 protein of unknown function [Aliiruegeria lutimaris]
MARPVKWALACVASVALHAAALAVLAVLMQPRPVPQQKPVSTELSLAAETVRHSSPDAQQADARPLTGQQGTATPLAQDAPRRTSAATVAPPSTSLAGAETVGLSLAADLPAPDALESRPASGAAVTQFAPDTTPVTESARPTQAAQAVAARSDAAMAELQPTLTQAPTARPEATSLAGDNAEATPVRLNRPDTARLPAQLAAGSSMRAEPADATAAQTLRPDRKPVAQARADIGTAPVVLASFAAAAPISASAQAIRPDPDNIETAPIILASLPETPALSTLPTPQGLRPAPVAMDSLAQAASIDASAQAIRPDPDNIETAPMVLASLPETPPQSTLPPPQGARPAPVAMDSLAQAASIDASAQAIRADPDSIETAPALLASLPDSPPLSTLPTPQGPHSAPVAPDVPTGKQSRPDAARLPDSPTAETATRMSASLAWAVGDISVADPVSVAAIQAFMQPSDPTGSGDSPMRDGLAALLTGIPCARLQTEFDAETGRLELRGHVPEDALRGPLLTALQSHIGTDIPVTDALQILPRPQCGALTGIANLGLPQSDDQRTNPRIVGPNAFVREFRFQEGDRLRLDLTAPDYDAYVYIDYFDADGSVLHLQPNEIVPLEKSPAKTALLSGVDSDGRPALNLTIAPPFGQEIVVAFASSAPLYDGLRPLVEPAEAYIAFLSERVEQARQNAPDFKGEWVYFFIATAPAQ